MIAATAPPFMFEGTSEMGEMGQFTTVRWLLFSPGSNNFLMEFACTMKLPSEDGSHFEVLVDTMGLSYTNRSRFY
ncbi:MAG: hypothetical protein Kow00121_49560 [Elainellaceae cyanobacterium]